MPTPQKEAETKLMKGLLDFIVLQLLSTQPMHGYQIITKIRKTFGVYFGPSTIYPLLNTLEQKSYVTAQWTAETDRPKKVYQLTKEGQNFLNMIEDSFKLISQKLVAPSTDQPEE